jgi:hypothetical protein
VAMFGANDVRARLQVTHYSGGADCRRRVECDLHMGAASSIETQCGLPVVQG